MVPQLLGRPSLLKNDRGHCPSACRALPCSPCCSPSQQIVGAILVRIPNLPDTTVSGGKGPAAQAGVFAKAGHHWRLLGEPPPAATVGPRLRAVAAELRGGRGREPMPPSFGAGTPLPCCSRLVFDRDWETGCVCPTNCLGHGSPAVRIKNYPCTRPPSLPNKLPSADRPRGRGPHLGEVFAHLALGRRCSCRLPPGDRLPVSPSSCCEVFQ